MKTKIDRDLLSELTTSTELEGWTVLQDKHLRNKRWTEQRRIVLTNPEFPGIWAFDYEIGLTEMQDFSWYDHYPEEIELFQVVPRTETVMVYEKAPVEEHDSNLD